MRNFIGNLLISLAAFITFIRNVLFFVLTVGLVMGILMVTIIAFFELIGRGNTDPRMAMPFILFNKWYWDLIVVFIGGATMWQGIVKMMFTEDKEEKKDLGKGWGNNDYHYGNKKAL